ncbi:D-alanyl-D-alanine carboxypeptidase DacF [Bacillus subtilis]|uniref:D-alanyl-D-alanine carboxypeptidase DacF n=7 Tax=Bacilli TaxID=91061 RepID=DACF_BACSU|nr:MULTISPECIES: D-alanyl-D-alanine carboxypeptidase DacF [Bacillales]NP_390229.1 D-alanyl-D-alanine carboxypeptidase (penicilin binding protein) [Bacillus subtilis subsp. subtilis str. 168]P38422.2 RecName: Full=D-alanyl-D-alanine carboxypeptidase DacF; Short=DD-carboxypeptidase; Short=DD-peptidase; AltName: Full=Penicillin-binding protein DacF; Short=PBP; Flags: Precursor [Bacillus subtilis subsp. subtilis str. 168]AOL30101.1 D-alanyl-D-alanine carboxypeptidase [Alkalicoccobacillus gibsonii]M
MKRLLSTLLIGIMLLTFAPSAFAKQDGKRTSELAHEAKSAVLIERDTGKVLYNKNSNERLAPASMTKIMTMLLIMEALDKGKIKMSDKVRTSEHAASMGGSQIFLEPGEEMTVKEMLKGIAIASGNDASVAMAEFISGSEEEFVKKMNKKAKELGLKNTSFKNPTGLTEEGHYSSAYDMAIMAKELLKYESITKFTGTYEDYLRENTDKKFWLVNTNRLIKFYPGVDGVKTGYTGEAKYCLTASAKKGNMRAIAVVFGASTPKERNAQVTKMLDFAFSQYETHPLYKRNQTVAKVKVKKGKQKFIELTTSEPISILTKKGEDMNDVKKEIKMKDNISAPIQKGQELGTLVLKKDGEVLAESPVAAKEDMKKAGFITFLKRTMGDWTKFK